MTMIVLNLGNKKRERKRLFIYFKLSLTNNNENFQDNLKQLIHCLQEKRLQVNNNQH